MDIPESVNNDFYDNGKSYWSEIPATIDGMLGGYGHVTLVDIQGSRDFLKQIFKAPNAPSRNRVLDCGAGIGRVTRNLLAQIFDTVDLVEQNAEFLQEAKITLQPIIHKIGEFYPVGLQEFDPELDKYDVIWIQWMIGHLTDDDIIIFLKKCLKSLRKNGIIVFKENINSNDVTEIDKTDSSYTRTYQNFMELFETAGYKCFKKQKQINLPKELYTVYMFGIKPK